MTDTKYRRSNEDSRREKAILSQQLGFVCFQDSFDLGNFMRTIAAIPPGFQFFEPCVRLLSGVRRHGLGITFP